MAYQLEYGQVGDGATSGTHPASQFLNPNVSLLLFQAEAEIQKDAVAPGQKVLVIDDLLATGGEKP